MTETGGDLYEALRYAQRAQLLAPNVPQIADTVAWVKLKLGWFDDAISTLAKVLVSEPDNAGYRAHMLQALEKTGVHSPKLDGLMAELREKPSPESSQAIVALLGEINGKPQRPK